MFHVKHFAWLRLLEIHHSSGFWLEEYRGHKVSSRWAKLTPVSNPF